jgi:hypothetical protein
MRFSGYIRVFTTLGVDDKTLGKNFFLLYSMGETNLSVTIAII